MTPRAIIWDFDGTLGERPGMWRRELVGALAEVLPGYELDAERLRPHLSHGFPWHEGCTEHPELSTADLWWEHLQRLLAAALVAVGIAEADAAQVARATRQRVVDPASYVIYDDAFPVLEALSARGWRHVILSNHVPELPQMAEALGIAQRVDAVLSSANLGYDKPHPETYRMAREAAGCDLAGDEPPPYNSAAGHGSPPYRIWMVGDNPVADVEGPEAAGIPAILVRNPEGQAARKAADLWAAARIIEQS